MPNYLFRVYFKEPIESPWDDQEFETIECMEVRKSVGILELEDEQVGFDPDNVERIEKLE